MLENITNAAAVNFTPKTTTLHHELYEINGTDNKIINDNNKNKNRVEKDENREANSVNNKIKLMGKNEMKVSDNINELNNKTSNRLIVIRVKKNKKQKLNNNNQKNKMEHYNNFLKINSENGTNLFDNNGTNNLLENENVINNKTSNKAIVINSKENQNVLRSDMKKFHNSTTQEVDVKISKKNNENEAHLTDTNGTSNESKINDVLINTTYNKISPQNEKENIVFKNNSITVIENSTTNARRNGMYYDSAMNLYSSENLITPSRRMLSFFSKLFMNNNLHAETANNFELPANNVQPLLHMLLNLNKIKNINMERTSVPDVFMIKIPVKVQLPFKE